MKNIIRILMVGLWIGCFLFFSGCEGSQDSPHTSSVSFKIQWPDEIESMEGADIAMMAAEVTLSDDCASRGVETVVGSIRNASETTLQSDSFDCEDKQGALTGITPGSGYTLVVSGRNVDGKEIYRGEKPVTLSAGSNNAGTIQVERMNNSIPVPEITSPSNNSTYTSGQSITFSGTGTDAEDGPLTGSSLVWESDLDGEIGAGISFSASDLSTGTHSITLTATDSDGLTDSDTVNIIIKTSGPPGDYTNSIGMSFILIDAGTFSMGSPPVELGRKDDEIQHQVTLTNDFYMQTTEVTQGQWEAVMDSNLSYFKDCGDNCPVETVNWDDAQAFVEELNRREATNAYRLPTEAQWEYACRAGSTSAFANGSMTATDCHYDAKLDVIGWYCGNSEVTYEGCYDGSSDGWSTCTGTHPVAQKQPNAWGLYDMHGNVFEWCADWYGGYPSSAVTDPEGPSNGSNRVVRGGSWFYYTQSSRSANRGYSTPNYRISGCGFRVVRMTDQPTSSSPVAEITGPSNNSTYISGQSISFSGTGTDPEDGELADGSLVWISNIDGEIGTGQALTAGDLSIGDHAILLTVTDSDGLTDSDTVNITINTSAPPGDYTNTIGMTFIYIDPGTFTMGSPPDELGRLDDEIQHQVLLTQGYFIQTTEVTQLQWRTVMGTNPSAFQNCGDNCPIEKVSWDDAQAFVEELNRMEETDAYSLPTEAQWEYACRAGSTSAFSNGDITEYNDMYKCNYDINLNAIGWYCWNSEVTYEGCYDLSSFNEGPTCSGTHTVAQKQPNTWGLYDMHGSVWEFCSDWYGDYPTSSIADPEGPSSGNTRVLRGGSWGYAPVNCRSASRMSDYVPGVRRGGFGFRLVLR